MIKQLLVIISLVASTFSVFADIKLPALVSNGMVLQREKQIPLWGWAAPTEKISINFKNKTYHAVADAKGKWLIKLPAMEAGGPYQMVISGTNKITISDILIGDVWVCSGQSNMEFEMFKAQDLYADEIAKANNPNIRQFEVVKKFSFTKPLKDVTATEGWQSVTPQNVLNFTAAGYFFAKELYQKYKIPIGLINATWGGTPAEAWVSEEGLKTFPAYKATLQQLKNPDQLNTIKNQDKATVDSWYSNIKLKDKGLSSTKQNWGNEDRFNSLWSSTILPSFWTDDILKDVNAGVVWYQKQFEIPAATGKKAMLYLGNIYNQDSTWINGILVGHTEDKHKARVYELDESVLKQGSNTITVRVLASATPPGFVKDKPYKIVIDKQEIPLSGEWKYQLGVASQPIPATTNLAYQPAVLFKGMVSPLIPYAIKGVIWYQGEANTAKALEYQTLFPALIKDWRKQWKQGDFPFLYVQLPNYLAVKPQPSQSNWAELREAQLTTLNITNTAMAVTYDIGEWNDIHPHNKKDVGYRLALAARHLAYADKDVVYSGPIYQSMIKKGNKIILSFKNPGSNLIAKGGSPLKYFAIAGADNKFVWADAVIKGDKVEVWSDKVPNPVAVRYAWADNPDGANLFNTESLPASPFRTDKP